MNERYLARSVLSRNGSEGQVVCRAAGAGAPLVEETAIAQREQFSRIQPKPLAGGVDPLSRTLKLCKKSDRRFIDDAMARRIGVFGTPLLISESSLVAELAKDDGHRLAILDFGFGFDAPLMAAGRIVVLGNRFVCHDPALSVFANAQNRLLRA